MRANPDSFVMLFPVTWSPQNAGAIEDVHGETWFERLTIEFDDEVPEAAPEDVEATGTLEVDGSAEETMAEDSPTEGGSSERDLPLKASLAVEPAIEKLKGATQTAKEPFTASEMALLEQHRAVWRVTVEDGETHGKRAARLAGRLMSTFVEAGAAGCFLPASAEMHSASLVKNMAQNLADPQAVANLFVSAWDADGWMITRGLTAFGLPELETRIDSGVNAAFFRLMDVACNMIIQGDSYPLGADLRVGHQSFRIEEGRQGPADEKVTIAGHFGVHTVLPGKAASG